MKIINHKVNGLQIGQRLLDGYINATQMCKANNKEWRYYWRSPNTQKYVKALAKDLGVPLIVNNPTCNNRTLALVLTFRGGNSQQGTWVHPEVALDLAACIIALLKKTLKHAKAKIDLCFLRLLLKRLALN